MKPTLRHTHAVHLAAAVPLLQLARGSIALKLKPRPDGWRRAAGLVLRDERSTFILSTFNLDIWSGLTSTGTNSMTDTVAHITHRLSNFLATQPQARVRIRMHDDLHSPETTTTPSFTLAFEHAPESAARFLPPTEWTPSHNSTQTPRTTCLMNIVARLTPDRRADLWFRFNHVGIDGVPAQQLITALEQEWGTSAPLAFPTPEAFAHLTASRATSSVLQSQGFVDFAPLLAWRRAQNAKLPEPMTITAALLWKLSRHPAFANLHLGSTVAVDPKPSRIGTIPAGVGVVVVRPTDYANDPAGLTAYVQAFNRQINLARTRESASMKNLDAAALLPPRLAHATLRHVLENVPSVFGDVGLTMLKDAKVFGAPLGSYGHKHGFIAIGSLSLPTADNRRVGCVTIKHTHSSCKVDVPTLVDALFRT